MKGRAIVAIACLLFALLPAQAFAGYVPPRGNWEEREPARVGMTAARLDAAIAFAQAHEFPAPRDNCAMLYQRFGQEPGFRIVGPVRERGAPTGLIVRHGYVVAKWGEPDRVDMTFSVSKSYLSAVAGLAFDTGLLPDIERRVAASVNDEHFSGAHNGAISWRHLLNQTSSWRGELFGLDDRDDRPPADVGIDEYRARAPQPPGAVFKYNDVRVNALAYALLQLWREPLPMVLRRGIMDPIGASPTWRWYGYDDSWIEIDGVMMSSISGGGHFGGGMFINAWDQARFGLLYLNRGNWNGRQLLSKQWLAQTRVPAPAKPNYGLLWWLNKGPSAWPGLSPDIYFADGTGGNYIVVDEAHDLLIVTRWMDEDRAVLGELIGRVLAAIE